MGHTRPLQHSPAVLQEAANVARTPNYNFERMERDRLKATEKAKKLAAKAEKRAKANDAPPSDGAE